MALQRGNAVSFHNYGHRVNCRCNHNFSACDFALEGLIIVIIYYILGHTVSVPRICLRIGGSGALCWEGQACYFRSGVKLEWPKLEAERADSRGGCFRRGKLAPCLPARGSGERCKLPQRDPAAEGSRGARWPLLELVGVTLWGGDWPSCSPLNSPMCLLRVLLCYSSSVQSMIWFSYGWCAHLSVIELKNDCFTIQIF